MRDFYKTKLSKIRVIYHGIELENFSKIAGAKFEKPYRLAIVGRLTEQKGHKFAIEALTKLTDVRLLITGNGELKNDLQDYAKELDVFDKIEWKEATTDIAQVYANSDIVLVPSVWEGLGLVVLEAMASDRLVIASAVDGILEIIKEGKTGLLFSSKDFDELADTIKEALLDKEKSLKIASDAKVWVQKNAGVEKMSAEYEKLYLNLAKNKI
jgi:glycosyltransferase involved in cell wall biosynthesis